MNKLTGVIKKIGAWVITVGFSMFVVFLVLSNNASAALPSESSTIAAKAYYRDVFNCYLSDSWLKNEITVGEFSGRLESLVRDSSSVDAVKQPGIGDENTKIGCGTLISSKVANAFGPYSTSTNPSILEPRLTKAYYAFVGGSRASSASCAEFPLKYVLSEYSRAFGSTDYVTKASGVEYTEKVCVGGEKGDYSVLVSGDEARMGWSSHVLKITFTRSSQEINVKRLAGNRSSEIGAVPIGNEENAANVLAKVGNKIADLIGSYRDLGNYRTTHNYIGTLTNTDKYEYWSACSNWVPSENGINCTGSSTGDGSPYDISFDAAGRATARYRKKIDDDVIKHFSNNQYDASSIKFTDLETYVLYQSYLTDVYGVSSIRCFDGEQHGRGEYQARLYSSEYGYTDYCYFDVSDSNKSKKVNGVFATSKYWGDLIDLDTMISRLHSLRPAEPPDSLLIESGIDEDGSIDDGDGGDGTGNTDPCWNSGIDSMAWVLCPAQTNLQYFASGLSGAVDKFLQMDSSLYDNESGAHTAWEYVRTFANVLMIIFLGAIIFSQLTGYGIDNYGIKKILPKLVVMAVLINLSFFVCQLVIDLSNIIGNGIQGLFYGVGNGILERSELRSATGAMEDFIGNLVPAVYAVAAGGTVAIGAASAAVASGGGVMAVLLIILMLLTIAIAILVFFISLGARIVIIIMCTVLAPLAFACYILPNTKPVFKKWYDAMKAAIVIYPICGAVMGIGYVIRAISVTQERDLAFVVISGIAPFLPFFMIPSMLKGAISALGVVGNALSTMGNTFKSNVGKSAGEASKQIRDSEPYKNASRLASEGRMRRRAGIDENGQLTKRGEKKAEKAKKNPKRSRLQAAYIAAAKKSVAADEEASSQLTNALSKSGIAGHGGDAETYYNEEYAKAASKGDIAGMNSVIAAAVSSGYLKDKDIAKIVRNNMGTAEGKMSKESFNSWVRDLGAKYGNGFMSTDFEMKHWSQNGGNGGTAKLGNYGDYATTMDRSDFKPEDCGKLSSDSLLGMAKAGIIDSSMAKSALEANPNMAADKKVMYNAIANGAKVDSDFKAKCDAALQLKNDDDTILIGGKTFTKTQVDAWTAVKPQDVNVVQNFAGGGGQLNPVDVAVQGETFNVREEAPASAPTNPVVGSSRADHDTGPRPVVGSARANADEQYGKKPKIQFRPHDPNTPR